LGFGWGSGDGGGGLPFGEVLALPIFQGEIVAAELGELAVDLGGVLEAFNEIGLLLKWQRRGGKLHVAGQHNR
jgi:hypothetical protein